MFSMSISLAKSMKIMERSRYTFWDVLGDIGGFHDGLILFLYFIMAPFSAKAFLNKFADSTPYLEKNKQMIGFRTFSTKLSESTTPYRLDANSYQYFERFTSQINRLKTNTLCQICDCLITRTKHQRFLKQKI